MMPYIKQDRRDKIDNLIDALIKSISKTVSDAPDGEVNYVISRIVSGVLADNNPLRYVDIARCIGAFESAKLEFYRRVASNLEDRAIMKNGDIKEYE